jgi:hypothetical protein
VILAADADREPWISLGAIPIGDAKPLAQSEPARSGHCIDPLSVSVLDVLVNTYAVAYYEHADEVLSPLNPRPTLWRLPIPARCSPYPLPMHIEVNPKAAWPNAGTCGGTGGKLRQS